MMRAVFMRRALRRTLNDIQHVTATPYAAADGVVATVYAQAERDFGLLAPPVALHSPAPDTLVACWAMLRETLLVPALADRAVKEAVAAAVSAGNACPYCVDVHAATLHSLVPGGVATEVATDPIGAVADPHLREVAAWARSSGLRNPPAAAEPSFTSDLIPELIGVAVTFHYLNRMVTIFLGDSPVPPRVPGAVRVRMLRMVGGLLRTAAHAMPEPADSLSLLAPAPAPASLSWANGNPRIADTFARASAAIEAAAEPVVPTAVRECLVTELGEWDGQARGPSRAWVNKPVSRLAPAIRPAARLALLTAMAPYQVVETDIEEFRRTEPGDAPLVRLTSWASLTAGLTAGRWLADRTRAVPAATR